MKFSLMKKTDLEQQLKQQDDLLHQQRLTQSINFQQSNSEINKDVIDRLFQSQKRILENKEKQKMMHYQKEMANI